MTKGLLLDATRCVAVDRAHLLAVLVGDRRWSYFENSGHQSGGDSPTWKHEGSR